MFVVIFLLVLVALGLHLNPSSSDRKLNNTIRFFKLLFSISIAILIPSIINYLFWDFNEYDLLLFHPIVMHSLGTVFSLGIQFLTYGKLYYHEEELESQEVRS